MAQRADQVAVYTTHDRSDADVLGYATIAEEALDRDASDRCSEALGHGFACLSTVASRRTDDHLHIVMRNLSETVGRARTALEESRDGAEQKAQCAIAALRWTATRLD